MKTPESFKLTDDEKERIREALRVNCGGTPLQPHADFVAQYLGIYVIGLVEERDRIFKRDT